MSGFQRLLRSQTAWARQVGGGGILWAFPATVFAGWMLFPALDYEWKMSLGLAPDPEAGEKMVQAAKMARLDILKGPQLNVAAAAPEEEEEEAEEEEAEPEEEEEAGEQGGDEPEPDSENEDDDDDDEEEVKIVTMSVEKVFGGKKSTGDIKVDAWENFSIKSVKMSEDDDDDEDEDEEEDGTL
jgi:hypothetical protein